MEKGRRFFVDAAWMVQAHLICPFLMAEVPLPLVQAGEGHWPEDADVPQLKMVTSVLQHHRIRRYENFSVR